MFDATSWPSPEPKPPRRKARLFATRLLATGVLTIAIAALATELPAPTTIIVPSPSNLRQLEIFENPFHETINIFLANAGFHSLHKHHLLATITGADGWQVTWQSDSAATIWLRPNTASITQFSAPGINIKFAT